MAAPLQFYNPQVAQVLSLAQQIRSFERISPSAQMALQQTQLHALLRHAWSYSPFWRQRLETSGFNPDIPTGDVLQRLPEQKREDFQESFEALRARWPELSADRINVTVTSGSTGLPVRVERALDIHTPLYEALAWVDVEWHERDPGKKVAVLGAGIKDGAQQSWGGIYALTGSRGPCVMRTLDDRSVVSHLDWLFQHRPDYLKCSPFVAAELAQLALEKGMQLPLYQIISQSERVTPRQRELCQKAFGAKIIDRYSCEESGWIALQCTKHNHLHVLNASVLIEIVDDDGQACPPGKVGRVLLTSLHSFAMPIIRYDLGDLAEWGESCDCGMTLPVIKRLWGRTRHRALLPSGEFLPMPFLGDDVGGIEPIRTFRIIQYRGGELEIKIQASRPLSKEEQMKVRDIFSSNGLAGLPLFVNEVETMDWGPGKREEFVRLDVPWQEQSA